MTSIIPTSSRTEERTSLMGSSPEKHCCMFPIHNDKSFALKITALFYVCYSIYYFSVSSYYKNCSYNYYTESNLIYGSAAADISRVTLYVAFFHLVFGALFVPFIFCIKKRAPEQISQV